MRAGRLDQRVTVQKRTAGSPQRTGSGAPDEGWVQVFQCWAAIEPLRGREFFAADAVQSEVKVRIRIRYRDDMTAAHRVVHGTTVYNVEAIINPRNRNEELQLMCGEGVNRG